MITMDTLKYASAKHLKVFAKTMIKYKERHRHDIKGCIVSEQQDFYAVVNKDTLKINTFPSEEAALNHVLDYYKSLGGEQEGLFN